MDSTITKKQLRQTLIKQRNYLSKNLWQKKSDRLCQILQQSPLFKTAITILAYFPIRREPDVTALFTADYNWGFSRCVDDNLVWHSWKVHEPLRKGKYGILEPPPNAPVLTASDVDLMLIPAVACDYQGYRLGYGGGFYDRLLKSPQWQAIPTIGIIFEFALFSQLPVDPWDQKLTAICTENQLISIST